MLKLLFTYENSWFEENTSQIYQKEVHKVLEHRNLVQFEKGNLVVGQK